MINLDQLMIFMTQYRRVLAPAAEADAPADASPAQTPNDIPLPFEAGASLAVVSAFAGAPSPMEASLSLVGLATPSMPAALPTREAMAALADALGRLVADAEDLSTSPQGALSERNGADGAMPARFPGTAAVAVAKPAPTTGDLGSASGADADGNPAEETRYPAHLSAEGRATPADGAPLRPADAMRAQSEPLAAPAGRSAAGALPDSSSDRAAEARSAATKGPRADRPRDPERTRLDSALSFLDLAMKTPQGGERTGIVSSFMFNAAMTPGWPQRPLASPMDLMSAVPPTFTEEDALGYLAALGANEQLLEKLRKVQSRSIPGRKVLFFIAALVTALNVVIDQLRQEIEDLAERSSDEGEAGEPGLPTGRASSRRIILG
jgi:hypothetical protein